MQEETSLVFFYAKQVPFVEASGRVLAGVGKINKIIASEAYEGSNNRFGAAYWEHMILHSIRKEGKNGFLLPYHSAIEYQQETPSFDVADLAVIVPNDKRFEFSYGTEHVSNDSAIRVLLDCIKSLEKAEDIDYAKQLSILFCSYTHSKTWMIDHKKNIILLIQLKSAKTELLWIKHLQSFKAFWKLIQ